MASDAVPARRSGRVLPPAALTLALAFGAQAAEPPGTRSIFQCEVNGKKVTSDRLIPECVHKEQRELNPDGSLRRIVPPTLTSDELAIKEQQDRDAKIRQAEQNDAVRRDRNLMQRFPDEAKHRQARASALEDIRNSARISESRIALLLAEKKTLDQEREFYENDRVKKALPHALRQKIDANDAALEAQRSLAQQQSTEVIRINALYDAELARLRKLWSGVQPGTLGPLPGTPQTLPSAAVLPAKSSSLK